MFKVFLVKDKKWKKEIEKLAGKVDYVHFIHGKKFAKCIICEREWDNPEPGGMLDVIIIDKKVVCCYVCPDCVKIYPYLVEYVEDKVLRIIGEDVGGKAA